MKNMSGTDYVIECIREDLYNLGISAKLYQGRVFRPFPILWFKSKEDMHLYKLFGTFKEGDYFYGSRRNPLLFMYGWKMRIRIMLGIEPKTLPRGEPDRCC